MRYAIVSDIHANLPAWKTVLADIALRKADRIICLGDTVGYGPEPAEVLKSVYEHVHLMVLGNHDAVVGGRMDAASFNDNAQRMIKWTALQLGDRARALFGTLPLVLKGDGFRCAHGGFADPAVFEYIDTPEEALESFGAVEEQLMFCGHSHRAGLFVVGASGVPHWIEPQDFALEDGKRYIVNVGSVGSPRDGSPRASYVIYDAVERSVSFYRATYDFEAYRAAAERAGLGPGEVPMLRNRAVGAPDAVRGGLDFSPGSGTRVSGGVVEGDVTALLRKSVAKWKLAALAAVAAGAVAVAAAFAMSGRNDGKAGAAYPAERLPPVSAESDLLGDGNCLPPVAAQGEGAGFTATPYRAVIGDAAAQSIAAHTAPGGSGTCVAFTSADASEEVRLEAPDIQCAPGERLEIVAKAAFSDDFRGAVTVGAWLVVEGEGGERLEHSPLRTMKFADQVGIRDENLPVALRGLPNSGGWWIARGTLDAIPGGGHVRVAVEGKFTGTVLVGGISARSRR